MITDISREYPEALPVFVPYHEHLDWSGKRPDETHSHKHDRYSEHAHRYGRDGRSVNVYSLSAVEPNETP